VALCRSGLAGKPATTTAYPTYCSGSRATVRNGANGGRFSFGARRACRERFRFRDLPASTPGHRTVSGSKGTDSRTALRRRIRKKRRALSGEQRQTAQQLAARRLRRLAPLWRARSLAVYLAVDGEADPATIAADALGRGERIYAPVLHGETLRFARFTEDTPLRRNRFGILEPATLDCIDPRQLDIVLTPLVAFDDSGTRIGMGGGYYDRCFSFLKERTRWIRPRLIGLAYEFQRLRSVSRNAWDIPLWAAVTERDTYRFQGGAHET